MIRALLLLRDNAMEQHDENFTARDALFFPELTNLMCNAETPLPN